MLSANLIGCHISLKHFFFKLSSIGELKKCPPRKKQSQDVRPLLVIVTLSESLRADRKNLPLGCGSVAEYYLALTKSGVGMFSLPFAVFQMRHSEVHRWGTLPPHELRNDKRHTSSRQCPSQESLNHLHLTFKGINITKFPMTFAGVVITILYKSMYKSPCRQHSLPYSQSSSSPPKKTQSHL